jgi:hypothetical protein
MTWFISRLGAFVTNSAVGAYVVMTKVAGVGHHEDWVNNMNPKELVRWAELVLILEFIHFAGAALPKLSILAFLLQMFNWRGKTRTACYVTMGLVVLIWLASTVATCFQCRPLAFWWDKSIPGGTCFDVDAFLRGQAITNPVLDAVIVLLPIRSIWALQLPERKRIELLFVFGVAGVGIIASIIRVQIYFNTPAFEDRTCW